MTFLICFSFYSVHKDMSLFYFIIRISFNKDFSLLSSFIPSQPTKQNVLGTHFLLFISAPLLIHLFFRDLNEASILWNLKLRYDNEMIYVSVFFLFSCHLNSLSENSSTIEVYFTHCLLVIGYTWTSQSA